MMNDHHQKVQASHLKRDAYLYIRQSTLRQVFENTESTKRQYGLRQRAVALGWADERVIVIDSNLGQSGAATDREGFKRLVAEAGMGWEATGVDTRPTEMLREARTLEEPVEFEAPEEGADVADDYASIGLTLRRHPLALIRHKLQVYRIRTAEDLRLRARDGQTVRASGIVTHRQQPGTASGVVFATLEDETGTVNLIVWASVAEEQRAALRQAKLLSVQGTWQSDKGVQSLVALKLRDHTELLEGLRVASRDFR